MDDDGVADGDMLDRGADSMHPAGILMAEHIGKPDMGLVLPLAFDDVEVGPAKPGAADAHDDVERPGDGGIGHFLDERPLAIGMQANGFHGYFFCSV